VLRLRGALGAVQSPIGPSTAPGVFSYSTREAARDERRSNRAPEAPIRLELRSRRALHPGRSHRTQDDARAARRSSIQLHPGRNESSPLRFLATLCEAATPRIGCGTGVTATHPPRPA